MAEEKEKKEDGRVLCTVHLKKRGQAPPNIVDGKVGGELVDDYVRNLQDVDLVEQCIAIGRTFKSFTGYFTENAPFIRGLRSRIPKSGVNCKIRVVSSEEDEGEILGWNQFCVKFFGVSADWVRKLLSNFETAVCEPPIDDKPAPEGEDEEEEPKQTPLGEAQREVAQAEVEIDRLDTRARVLEGELHALITKIGQVKDGKLSLEELLVMAEEARNRVLSPEGAGKAMNTGDKSFDSIDAVKEKLNSVGTDDLLDQISQTLKKKAAPSE